MKLPLLTIQFRNKRKIRSKKSERSKNFLLIYRHIIVEKQADSIGFYEPNVSQNAVTSCFWSDLRAHTRIDSFYHRTSPLWNIILHVQLVREEYSSIRGRSEATVTRKRTSTSVMTRCAHLIGMHHPSRLCKPFRASSPSRKGQVRRENRIHEWN